MSILSIELALPAYTGLTDAEAATALNLVDISIHKTSMSGSELLDAQDASEFIALTDTKKAQWLALCGIGSVDPYGQVVDVVKNIWGNGSTTVSNLAGARTTLISRASQLGFGKVREGEVARART